MAYIGNSPSTITTGRQFIYEFTATAGQTVFTGADDNNQTLDLLDAYENSVYLNGIRLVDSDDFTISGDTLTLTSAASLNDVLVVHTQDMINNINSYTRAEADARYVNYNGDVIAGDISISGYLKVDGDTFYVDDSDNTVGIGTTQPARKFEVSFEASSVAAKLTRNDAVGSALIEFANTAGVQNLSGYDAGRGTYSILDGSSNPLVVVKNSSGYVGIGVTNPGGQIETNVAANRNFRVRQSTDDAAGVGLMGVDNSTGGLRDISIEGEQVRLSTGSYLSGTSTARLTVLGSGNVGIGTTNPSTKLHVVGDGSIADNAAATIGLDLETGNITSGAQYGLKINQLGSRYNGQVGVFSEILGTNGYFSGDTIEGLGSVRGVGVLGKVPGSSHAYQRNVGIWGISENTNMNYNTAYGVRGEAAVGTNSFSATNSTEQGAFAGWFQAHGKGRSVGVYADAYLDASPGAGAEAIPIVAASNGTEVFRVQANGNVGIGTTDPKAILDVKGSSADGQISLQLRSGDISTVANSVQVALAYDNEYNYRHSIRSRHNSADGLGNAIDFYAWQYGQSAGAIGNQFVMTIDGHAGGRVGIGKTNPDAPLHVVAPASGAALMEALRITDTSGYNDIAMYAGAADGEIKIGAAGQLRGSYKAQYAGTGGSYNFNIGTNATNAITIDTSQNVSIGAGSSPSERLQIGGNFRAGNTGATTSFDAGGNDRYIGLSSLNGGDAMFIAHASGYGVAYFGYEPTDDKLIIACDNGGGNNKIDFSVNAGTNANGSTDNLSGITPAMRIAGNGNVGIGTETVGRKLTIGGGNDAKISFVGGGTQSLYFGDGAGAAEYAGYIHYAHSDDIMRFNSTGDFNFGGGNLLPVSSTQDLGDSDNPWQNIYTQDLMLSNEKREEGNSVDGTKGNWTIQEGENDLYIINNKNGKKFRFALEEIV